MTQSEYRIRGRTASAIASSIEAAVISGHLHPGERLPPVRALAIECGVSPATAAAAFRRLRDRGLVHSDGRRGTRIVPRPGGTTGTGTGTGTGAGAGTGTVRPVKVASHGTHNELPRLLRDLANGNPDPALLPDLTPVLARIGGSPVLYGADKEV